MRPVGQRRRVAAAAAAAASGGRDDDGYDGGSRWEELGHGSAGETREMEHRLKEEMQQLP